tara:strand:- start:236 stop:442 length:207 start_codon:yes stop_codon:yes gene_type:complete
MESSIEENYQIYLDENLNDYLGEWVAICKGEIVAHGGNVKQVYSEAKSKYPHEDPLLAKVPEKETTVY